MAFESLSEKLGQVFKKLRGKGRLGEADIKLAMREVRIALLEADVNIRVAKAFIDRVSLRAVGAEVMNSLTPAQQVIKIVNEELTALMGSENEYVHIKSAPPTVILLAGLQGSGKTTHAAKLARYFAKQGHRPLLVACDVYRPAAADQLKTVGAQAGAPVFSLPGESPEAIAGRALAHGKDHGNDIIIIDTAGRLHVDAMLMAELRRIKKAVQADETLLVVDAMSGQDAVNVAGSFDAEIGLDGVILTKLDGDTRGGAALSVREVTGKPIKFAGVGEKLDDLEAFYPSRMAGRILGMGDVLTLIEKAQNAADTGEAEKTARRLLENKFDLNDLLAQLRQLKKMGGAAALMKMLPGGAGAAAGDVDEGRLAGIEAIILSMTPAERGKPKIIDPKRKRRIAAGSGTRVEDVNRLLKMHDQTSKMMKQFRKNPRQMARMMNGTGGL